MLLFSILVFLSSVGLAAIYVVSFRKAGLFDPATQFLFFYTLFVLPLPIRLLFTDVIEGDITPFLPNIAPYIPVSLLLCAAGLPVFFWSYYSRTAVRIAAQLPVPDRPKRSALFRPFFWLDRSRLAGIVICGCSLFLLAQLARAAGVAGLLGFLLLGYNSTEAMYGRGYLAAGFPWFFVGSLFFLYRYAFLRRVYGQYCAQCQANNQRPRSAKRLHVDLVIFALLFLLQILALFILGDRHSILNMVLVLLVFWNFAIRKVRFWRLSVVALICFVGLNVVGQLRTSNYQSLDAFISSTGEHATRLGDNRSTFIYTIATGEFVVPFETMPQVIRKIGGNEVQPQWGLTYLKALLQFIPQVLFPSRPAPLDHWYMVTYYKGTWPPNFGRSFFFLSEGYLNFGPAGVFITMTIWGLALGVWNQYRRINAQNHGAVLLYAICVSFLFRAIAGSSATIMVGLPEQFLLVAIIGLMISSGFTGGYKNSRFALSQSQPQSPIPAPEPSPR